jgi:hypothetical protein
MVMYQTIQFVEIFGSGQEQTGFFERIGNFNDETNFTHYSH